MRKKPDPATRLVSHALVSLIVGYVVANNSGPVPGLMAAAIAAIAHEELDAPLAQLLTDAGL